MDTTAWIDIWTSASVDGGVTWREAFLLSATAVEDEYFSRLTSSTTEEYVYCVTMYGAGGVDGPLYCLQVPVDDYITIGVNDSPRPEATKLGNAIPNPSHKEVSLSLALAGPAEITANAYNARGDLVQTLSAGTMAAGTHELVFDGRAVPAGIYFCRIDVGSETIWRKMVLVP